MIMEFFTLPASCDTNIARATRRANRRSHDLITAVTSSNPRTQ